MYDLFHSSITLASYGYIFINLLSFCHTDIVCLNLETCVYVTFSSILNLMSIEYEVLNQHVKTNIIKLN